MSKEFEDWKEAKLDQSGVIYCEDAFTAGRALGRREMDELSEYWRDRCKCEEEFARVDGAKQMKVRAAKLVRDECMRVLATQTGKKDSLNAAIDTNTRMICVLLPDIADAIEAIPEEVGKEAE